MARRKKLQPTILDFPMLIGWEDVHSLENYVALYSYKTAQGRLDDLYFLHNRLAMKIDDPFLRSKTTGHADSTAAAVEHRLRTDRFFRKMSAAVKVGNLLGDWKIRQTLGRALGADAFFYFTHAEGWELIYAPPVSTGKTLLWRMRDGYTALSDKMLGVSTLESQKILSSFENARHELKKILIDLTI